MMGSVFDTPFVLMKKHEKNHLETSVQYLGGMGQISFSNWLEKVNRDGLFDLAYQLYKEVETNLQDKFVNQSPHWHQGTLKQK